MKFTHCEPFYLDKVNPDVTTTLMRVFYVKFLFKIKFSPKNTLAYVLVLTDAATNIKNLVLLRFYLLILLHSACWKVDRR